MGRQLHLIEDWERRAERSKYCAVTLAKSVDRSERQLRRWCVRTHGVPLKTWLATVRMAKAKRLLSQGLPTKAVALELGFKHASNFCECFKRACGVCPGLACARPAGEANVRKT